MSAQKDTLQNLGLSHDNTIYDEVKLKYVADIIDPHPSHRAPPLEPDSDFHYLGIKDISGDGSINENGSRPISEDVVEEHEKRYGGLQDGDLVYCKVGTVGKPRVLRNPPRAALSATLLLVRPNMKINPRYLYYALDSDFVQSQVENLSGGSTRDSVGTNDVRSLTIPLPSLRKQKIISKYLDSKVGQIQQLAEKLRKIELTLDEKADVLKINYMTKGLSDQPLLKSSGIPSIGQIPSHWKIVPNRAIFTEIDEESKDGSEDLLTVSDTTGVTLRSEKDVNMFEADSLEGYKIAQQGDLVINTMWAWKGAVGIAPQLGLVSPSYHVYRPNGRITSEFADIFYRIPPYVAEMERFSKGVWKSRNRLYPDAFLSMDTVLPPIEEQNKIVQEYNRKMDSITKKLNKISRLIELEESKSEGLVSEVITGQIPLTNQDLS